MTFLSGRSLPKQFIATPLLAALSLIASPALAQSVSDLLRSSPQAAAPSPDLPPAFTVVRSRRIAVDSAFLSKVERLVDKQRGPLRARLFDDAEFLFLRTRVEPVLDDRGFHWFGSRPGSSLEEAVLSVLDGRLSASFHVDGRFYRLEPLEDGDYRISELRVDRPAAPESDAVAAPAGPLDPILALAKLGVNQGVLAFGVSTVDILGVYTPAARNRAGGSQAIQDKIALAVAEANSSFKNSAIPLEFHLAGMAQVDAQGSEAASSSYLSEITFNRPDIAALRDAYGADLVSMFIDGPGANGGVVGIGWLYGGQIGFDAYAYSISETNWAVGPSYTFSHEAGHNMGLAHDRAHAGSSGVFSYSYGYQHTTSPKFYTIMAYSAGCGGCAPLNYWSNPQVNYGNPPTPTGVDASKSNSADAARTLTQTGPIAAGWRPTRNPPANRNPIANPQSVETTANTSVSVTLTGSDPDNDPIAFQIDSPPSHGTLSGSGANRVYTPASGFSGVDQFDFEVYDNRGGFSTARVTITVGGSSSLPPPPSSAELVVETVATTASTGGWTSVPLSEPFTAPTPVCTAEYAIGAPPALVRVRSVKSSGFQIRLARADGSSQALSAGVSCLVVEAGVFTLSRHGVRMEAGSYVSSVTDRRGSWTGEAVPYRQSYGSPVVVGQVMTANDASFSSFWTRNDSSAAWGPDSSSMRLGKHVGEDPNTSRATETVGYIVIEAGSGMLDELPYEAGVGAASVTGSADNAPATYTLSALRNASSAVLSSAGMRGNDGGWPILSGPGAVSGSAIELFIEEDQLTDAERRHGAELVAYIAFEGVAAVPNQPPVADSRSVTTEAGQAVAVKLTGSDPDGDPLTFSVETAPAHGSLSGVAPSLTYTPHNGYSGPDAFTFRVSDNRSGSDVATVSITVEAAPPPPSAPPTGELVVESVFSFVGSDGWTRIPLSKSFVSPIPVCTAEYAAGQPPAAVRLRGLGSTGFELRLARLDGSPQDIVTGVRCIVVEQGVFTAAEHGVRMEARSVAAAGTSYKNTFNAADVPYAQSYASPVVLGQVATANDALFSVFWASGSSSSSAPSGSGMKLGKHVAEDPNTVRATETLTYLVIEAGSGVMDGYAFEAGVGPLTVQGSANGVASYPLGLANTSSAVLSSAGMRGGDGGWPTLAAVADSELRLFIEEDELRDSERSHTSEQVAYLALASGGPANRKPTAHDATATTHAGQAVAIHLSGNDPDGDPLTFSVTVGPSHGSLSGVAPKLTYTPAQGYSGPDSFTFRVDDGRSGRDEAVVSIHVEAPVAPPPPSGGLTAETVRVSAGSSAWTSVTLSQAFGAPIPVCTAEYAAGLPPAAVRMRNLSGSGFQIRLARLDHLTSAISADVQCFVVEEGVYTLGNDGVKMEAGKFTSTVTDNRGSWAGQAVAYRQSYASPVVLGQVATANDSRFSVFWAKGATSGRTPEPTALNLGKHVGEDPDTARASETLTYIVIEAGRGSIAGRAFEAGVGPGTIQGPDDGTARTYSHGVAGATAAVLSQAGMYGADGTIPTLDGPTAVSGSKLRLFVDEDQLFDAERRHTGERIAYLVLGP